MALLSVRTKAGYVKGVRGNDPGIAVFKGIPYAEPPVGNLRFAPPKPHASWEGELVCDDFGPTPIEDMVGHMGDFLKEFYYEQMPTSEDCLRLHVWTPAKTGEEKLPVMVWIHGGGFMRGYAYEVEMDGEAICKRGCIMVSVAYRLGPLGFLTHPFLSARSENGFSGNYGIMDQICALEWVRDNIAAFGGDPDCVTIFGQSAGGASMRALLVSPKARGLFHRCIIQSAGGIGNAVSAGTYETDLALGTEFVERLGWAPEELLTRSAEEVYFSVLEESYKAGKPMSFRPHSGDDLIPDSIEMCMDTGRIAPVPVMCGSVAGDRQGDIAAFMDKPNYTEDYLRLAPAAGPAAMGFVYGRNGYNPAYIYYFNRQLPGGDDWGASSFHTCELWYTFGTLMRSWRPFTGYDFELSCAMTDYWTQFAKTGDPNLAGRPAWPACTKDAANVMLFGNASYGTFEISKEPALTDMVRYNIEKAGL